MDIPEKVINRLTLYHFILDNCDDKETYISSNRISELLNIDNSQVRKDIRYLDNSGKSHVGYDVKQLKHSIERALGFKKIKNVFIVGAGNLGSALAKYDSFSNYGLNILAMFDNDPLKVGNTVNGKNIYHISMLKQMAETLNVDVAILTVPKEVSNSISELLINSNIRFIWNFTPSILDLPKDIKIRNENLIGDFLQFTHSEILKHQEEEYAERSNMEKITVKVCVGSTCFVLGREILQKLNTLVPEKYGDKVEISSSPCLGLCSIKLNEAKAPYVKIDEDILENASCEKILEILDKKLSE